MDIYQELSLEQQFELKVFEESVQRLSQQEAQALLIQLKGSMLYQTTAFLEILRNSWGIDKPLDANPSEI